MATTNDLKNGMVLNLDGQLWQVIWFQHHKPGKGGAVVRTKLKNVESGKTVDKTFNADVKVDVANVDKRTMQYLYNDGTSYVFMDTQTYDQLEVDPDIVGDAKNFLLENQEAIVATNEGRVLYIELPASVELEITFTEPGVAGDSRHRPHQAGHARDRPRDPGPAVHHPGREGQGRHPRLLLPRPRQVLTRHVPARTKARKRALDVLFASELRGEDPVVALDRAIAEGEGPTNDYTGFLVRGVAEHRARIDELLATYSEGWTLARMPAVDRNVLRIGACEILYVDDVPDAVAVTEAMRLVRDLSTDESPAFVNGVLGALLRDKDVVDPLTRASVAGLYCCCHDETCGQAGDARQEQRLVRRRGPRRARRLRRRAPAHRAGSRSSSPSARTRSNASSTGAIHTCLTAPRRPSCCGWSRSGMFALVRGGARGLAGVAHRGRRRPGEERAGRPREVRGLRRAGVHRLRPRSASPQAAER